jgi:uncharacterized alkaline shock family protein YloU
MSTPDAAALLPVPGQRGQTTIADRVVTRVATRAVAEVEQTRGTTRQLMGFRVGRQGDEGAARVSVRIDGHLAMIQLRVSLAYPVPVRSLTREVRRHVIEQVTGLTGFEVRHVDIEVVNLLSGRNR